MNLLLCFEYLEESKKVTLNKDKKIQKAESVGDTSHPTIIMWYKVSFFGN
jgi:hypothetical protein